MKNIDLGRGIKTGREGIAKEMVSIKKSVMHFCLSPDEKDCFTVSK